MQYGLAISLLLFIGLYLLLDLSSIFREDGQILNLTASTRRKKRARIVSSRLSRPERFRMEIEDILAATNQTLRWNGFVRNLIIAMVLGTLIGPLLHNGLLSVLMAIFLPILYTQLIRMRGMDYKRFLLSQMEDAMGIITTNYMQTDDLSSIMQGYCEHAELPLKGILLDCANELRLNSNPQRALSNMSGRIDSRAWREWCDVLIQTQTEHESKALLFPIVRNLAAMRRIQVELDTQMAEIWREHIILSLLAMGSIPMVRLFNTEWYALLVGTTPGHIAVAIVFLAIMVSTIYVMRVNRPITMERQG